GARSGATRIHLQAGALLAEHDDLLEWSNALRKWPDHAVFVGGGEVLARIGVVISDVLPANQRHHAPRHWPFRPPPPELVLNSMPPVGIVEGRVFCGADSYVA